MLKRVFDLAVALLLIVLLAPLLAGVAIVIAWRMGRPVLFRQQRPGWHGRPFRVLKFRTMTDAVDAAGQPLPDGARLTPLGAALRRYSLDELPQLFNVALGELSLVGPRPLLMEYLPLYSAEQARRHEVRPGITGWAQVNGRNAVSWEERLAMDVWYVDHRSFWLDLKILWLTVRAVFARHGVSHPGHVSMPKFTGTKPNANGGKHV